MGIHSLRTSLRVVVCALLPAGELAGYTDLPPLYDPREVRVFTARTLRNLSLRLRLSCSFCGQAGSVKGAQQRGDFDRGPLTGSARSLNIMREGEGSHHSNLAMLAVLAAYSCGAETLLNVGPAPLRSRLSRTRTRHPCSLMRPLRAATAREGGDTATCVGWRS